MSTWNGSSQWCSWLSEADRGFLGRSVTGRRLIFALIVSVIVFFSALFFLSTEAQAKSGGGSGGSGDGGGSGGGGGGKNVSAPPADAGGGGGAGSAEKSGRSGGGGDGSPSEGGGGKSVTPPPAKAENGGGGADFAERGGSGGGGGNPSEGDTTTGNIPSGAKDLTNNTLGTNSPSNTAQVQRTVDQAPDAGLQHAANTIDKQPAENTLKSAEQTANNTLVPPVRNAQQVADKVSDSLAPITGKVSEPLEPVIAKAAAPLESITGKATDSLAPIIDVNGPLAPINDKIGDSLTPTTDEVSEPLEPIPAKATDPTLALDAEPVLRAATPQTAEPLLAAATLETVSPGMFAPLTVHQPVLLESLTQSSSTYSSPVPWSVVPAPPVSIEKGAASQGGGAAYSVYSGSATKNSAATSTTELSGSLPRLFDEMLFSSRYSSVPLLSAAAVLSGVQGRSPVPPLFPSGFPYGLPPPVAGSFFGGAASGIGLDLLAVIALLSLLFGAGRVSWQQRDTFRPLLATQLVPELPG